MAITASGVYGLTEEKRMINTAGISLESETLVKGLLVQDAYTPSYDVHDFRDDITNEVSGTGYTAGGVVLTGTEVTVGSPAAGQTKWDHNDPTWPASTITNAMALVDYYNVGTAATDMLHLLLDFVTAVSTTNGLLTVQLAANGAVFYDLTP
jgi:hypothetical protein